MDSEAERLKFAQWILERNLAWIAASDTKTGAVIAVDAAMLATLAAAFSAAGEIGRTPGAWILTLVSAALLCIGIIYGALTLYPRTDGPPESHIFAGGIAANALDVYAARFRNATPAELLDDCLAQVHRNAQIANEKFRCVKTAMGWSFSGALPWFFAIAVLMNR
jgi:hypothetical protein